MQRLRRNLHRQNRFVARIADKIFCDILCKCSSRRWKFLCCNPSTSYQTFTSAIIVAILRTNYTLKICVAALRTPLFGKRPLRKPLVGATGNEDELSSRAQRFEKTVEQIFLFLAVQYLLWFGGYQRRNFLWCFFRTSFVSAKCCSVALERTVSHKSKKRPRQSEAFCKNSRT